MRTWMLALCLCVGLGCQTVEPDRTSQYEKLVSIQENLVSIQKEILQREVRLAEQKLRLAKQKAVWQSVKWEYKVLTVIKSEGVDEDRLNLLGGESWEAVTTYQVGTSLRILLKRRRQ